MILLDETEKVIQAARDIKQTGATGAYTQDFEKMEDKRNAVIQLLLNTTKSSGDLGLIDTRVDQLR